VIVLWVGASDVLAGRMTGGAQPVHPLACSGERHGAVSETWGDVQRAAGAPSA